MSADWLCHLVTIFLLAEIIAADAQVAQGHLVPSVSFFEIILYCKTHLGVIRIGPQYKGVKNWKFTRTKLAQQGANGPV